MVPNFSFGFNPPAKPEVITRLGWTSRDGLARSFHRVAPAHACYPDLIERPLRRLAEVIAPGRR